MGAASAAGQRVRRVVADTGPVLHLYEAQVLHLLGLTGAVVTPSAVERELHQQITDWAAQRPSWLAVEQLDPAHASDAAAWQQAGLLDPGEAEAIALAQQVQADWLLTDDAAARLFAEAAGLEAHGSLGIVLWAAALGHLPHADAHAALDRLAASSLWISARVLAEARAAVDQLRP
jgi:predicted nucleic acid-binding protein